MTEGTREDKFRKLDDIVDFNSLSWQECPDEWHASFMPAGAGDYFDWPLLTDLMPWQHSGVQLKRTWPIGPNEEVLEKRWRALLSAEDRSKAFKESSDRKISKSYSTPLTDKVDSTPIENLANNTPVPPIQSYAYRSFDRQYIIADGRLMSRPRPDLWRAHSDRQIYLTSLLTKTLWKGSALTACTFIPDLDHFSGRGAKDTIPLYRISDAAEANILPGLLERLSKVYGKQVTPEDFLAYVYAMLAHHSFTASFFEELKTRELRVPITKDAAIYEQVREIGRRLLWLHTYGERYVPEGRRPGDIPQGEADCVKPVPSSAADYPESFSYNEETQTLYVGKGKFAPVSPDVYEFEVSGLKVVKSWLGNRMKEPDGRRSSPLDDINVD